MGLGSISTYVVGQLWSTTPLNNLTLWKEVLGLKNGPIAIIYIHNLLQWEDDQKIVMFNL